jgi:hypothetical protein
MKITEVAQTTGLTFSTEIVVTEIALGHILGDFFTDASGRTAHRPQSTPLKTIEQK